MLADAIAATFARRETAPPAAARPALSAAFADATGPMDHVLCRTDIALAPERFPDTRALITALTMPPIQAVRRAKVDQRWGPGGPWRKP